VSHIILAQHRDGAGQRVAVLCLLRVIALQEHPEVIILDILLPGIDGFEVISRLKQEPRTKDIEVVVVSIIDDKERGFRLGAYDYYCKPLEKEKLLSMPVATCVSTKR
jgi:PleD family two-component response regulator